MYIHTGFSVYTMLIAQLPSGVMGCKKLSFANEADPDHAVVAQGDAKSAPQLRARFTPFVKEPR
jgi:hypothetical protein